MSDIANHAEWFRNEAEEQIQARINECHARSDRAREAARKLTMAGIALTLVAAVSWCLWGAWGATLSAWISAGQHVVGAVCFIFALHNSHRAWVARDDAARLEDRRFKIQMRAIDLDRWQA